MIPIKTPNYQHCPFCGQKLRNLVEEKKQRKHCQYCNWTYYPHVAGAVGAIITKNNKMLLVQRSRDPYRGTWMFPAGFIDYGEHPDEALQREVKEETGCAIKKFQLFKIIQTIDDPRSPGHFTFFYKVILTDGHLITDWDENNKIGWFDIQHPPKIGWISHQEILKTLQ